MERLVKLVALICLLQDVAHSHLDGVNEFCSNVQRMYDQCSSYNSESSYDITDKRGKVGPKDQNGEPARSDASIDYEIIERMLQQKIENVTFELMKMYVEINSVVEQHSSILEALQGDLNASTVTDCSQVLPGNSGKVGFQSIPRPVLRILVAGRGIDASCDLTTDGGGWTVIQRRMDGSVNFFRNHSDYVEGFGSVYGEFWIGLQNLYNILQASKKFQLRIDMEDWGGVKKFAKYSQFSIGGPTDEYSLTVSGFSGSVGDSFSEQNGQKFSTRDRDLDVYSANCAELYKGGWWYSDCHSSNLNGHFYKGGPHDSYADGINWRSWKGYQYSLKFVEMKIKPIA